MTKTILVALALGTAAANAAPSPASSQASIEKDFAAMDANRDGRVDRAEYLKFRQARDNKQAQTIDEGLKALDKDSDGKISKAEAAEEPQLAKYFDALDTNKDGFLSRGEMQNALTAAQAAGGEAK